MSAADWPVKKGNEKEVRIYNKILSPVRPVVSRVSFAEASCQA